MALQKHPEFYSKECPTANCVNAAKIVESVEFPGTDPYGAPCSRGDGVRTARDDDDGADGGESKQRSMAFRETSTSHGEKE